MDNLTHALVGAAIAKAGADRATPLATATLVLAANAPDIDVLSFVRGPYFALSFRRGITHGWPALIVLPFVVAGVMLAWDRWVRLRRNPEAHPARAGPLLLLSVVGLLTHPTLDWMNTYGMRWGLPLDGSWSYGDALFIIDPWIWLALGGAVFLSSEPGRTALIWWAALGASASVLVLGAMPGARLAWIVGMGSIIALWRRGRHPGPRGRRLVQVAGGIVLLYVGALAMADGVARGQAARSAEGLGLTALDVMIAPKRGNPFVSGVEVLTSEGYVPGIHRWFGTPRVELLVAGTVPLVAGPAALRPEELLDIVETARASTDVVDYLTWARYPFFRVEPGEGGWDVVVGDARYDDEPGAAGLGGLRVRVPGPDSD